MMRDDRKGYRPACHQTLSGDSSLSTPFLYDCVKKGEAHIVGTGLISGGDAWQSRI